MVDLNHWSAWSKPDPDAAPDFDRVDFPLEFFGEHGFTEEDVPPDALIRATCEPLSEKRTCPCCGVEHDDPIRGTCSFASICSDCWALRTTRT